jgi:hypothetical protein
MTALVEWPPALPISLTNYDRVSRGGSATAEDLKEARLLVRYITVLLKTDR